jgi:hypothetical protein
VDNDDLPLSHLFSTSAPSSSSSAGAGAGAAPASLDYAPPSLAELATRARARKGAAGALDSKKIVELKNQLPSDIQDALFRSFMNNFSGKITEISKRRKLIANLQKEINAHQKEITRTYAGIKHKLDT